MTGTGGIDVVVRFAGDVPAPERDGLLSTLHAAGATASAGWDLGYRGPASSQQRVVALLSLAADITDIGAAAAAELGHAVSGFLRAVAPPDEAACAELVERPSQRAWRLRATDSPLAFHQLRLAAAQAPADGPASWNGTSWSDEPAGSGRPAAFVSYAHDNGKHNADVLAFCEVLAAAGIEPRLDRYHLERRRDWQLWATTQLTSADFILVMASEDCRLVGDGQNAPQDNRGLQAEMRTLRELYVSDTATWQPRILPVVLPGQRPEQIPLFLQPWTADHYRIEEISPDGLADLLSVLHGRPPYRTPPVGPVPGLPPHGRA